MRVVLEAGPSAEALHEQIAGALDLPGWYGCNLDALWDVLTDRDVVPVLHLTLRGDGPHLDGFDAVFREAAAERPGLRYARLP